MIRICGIEDVVLVESSDDDDDVEVGYDGGDGEDVRRR